MDVRHLTKRPGLQHLGITFRHLLLSLPLCSFRLLLALWKDSLESSHTTQMSLVTLSCLID